MTTNLRFAIVDGNRNFHNLFRGVLRSLGWRRIDEFYSIDHALAHVRSTYVDLTFTDIRLPDGNGVDLIRLARHRPLANPTMPIVLLTSFTSKYNIEQAVMAGADLVVAKPIIPKLIAERIEALTSRDQDYVRAGNGYFGPVPDLDTRRRAVRGDLGLPKLTVEELQPRSHHRQYVAPPEELALDDAIYLD